jgi:hypothetical protein
MQYALGRRTCSITVPKSHRVGFAPLRNIAFCRSCFGAYTVSLKAVLRSPLGSCKDETEWSMLRYPNLLFGFSCWRTIQR